ncbi:ISL3 family transposase [Hutsoniella sourekii]|uniref:ISL3 family transposase n=1 Tax=Hutsoniella sourekii TaxID=87650 RepID=UPI0004BA98CA|nr:ISL3 family transposase [Hutsoniella sourekii]
MTLNHCIAKLTQMKEPHITFEKRIEEDQKKVLLFASLTYTPTCCEHCGVVNQSAADIIRHGSKTSTVLLGQFNFQAIYLKLKKQRFLYKHCGRTFTAQTKLVEPHFFISQPIKQMILFELKETQAMSLIAKRLHVSSQTVIRVLEGVLAAEKKYLPSLPIHLAIDKFKSVKQVKGAMSCVLVNSHRHTLFDVLEDRTQATLRDYFLRYPLEERLKVQTITLDMYSPYYQFLQQLFPNAQVIIDRFNIVQLLNRTLNQLRIQVMNRLKTKQPRDYRKLKQQWRLLLKNANKLDFTHYQGHRLYEGLMTEKMMVNYLIQLDPKLAQAHDWVNRIKVALERRDFPRLLHWLEESHKYTFSRPLRKSFQTLERYLEGIQNACHYTLSNGYIEGLNNKIKLMKRTGYGYRRFDHLKARIFLSQNLKDRGFKEPRPLTFEEERQLQVDSVA